MTGNPSFDRGRDWYICTPCFYVGLEIFRVPEANGADTWGQVGGMSKSGCRIDRPQVWGIASNWEAQSRCLFRAPRPVGNIVRCNACPRSFMYLGCKNVCRYHQCVHSPLRTGLDRDVTRGPMPTLCLQARILIEEYTRPGSIYLAAPCYCGEGILVGYWLLSLVRTCGILGEHRIPSSLEAHHHWHIPRE